MNSKPSPEPYHPNFVAFLSYYLYKSMFAAAQIGSTRRPKPSHWTTSAPRHLRLSGLVQLCTERLLGPCFSTSLSKYQPHPSHAMAKKYLPAPSLLPPPTGCSLALSRCSPALSRNLSLSLDPTQQLRTPSSSLPLCFSLCPAVAVLRGDGASARSSRRGRCPLRLPPAVRGSLSLSPSPSLFRCGAAAAEHPWTTVVAHRCGWAPTVAVAVAVVPVATGPRRGHPLRPPRRCQCPAGHDGAFLSLSRVQAPINLTFFPL